MRKLLITGFEPFGGEAINPSWEALKLIPDVIKDFNIVKMEIPVVFGKAAEIIIEKAEEIGADVILCIGQAGGRDAITPEMLGINLRHASIPDNEGNQPLDEKIIEGGDVAYFTTLPARAIAEKISAKGIGAKVSYSAGAYVCNDVIYSLLAHFNGSDVKLGFIHIPYSKEQGKEPSMSLDKISLAIVTAIETI